MISYRPRIERSRGIILEAEMLAVDGRVKRDVIYLLANILLNSPSPPVRIGNRDAPNRPKDRDILVALLHVGAIRIKARLPLCRLHADGA